MYKVDKPRQCIICANDLSKETDLYHLFYHSTLCGECISRFKIIDENIYFHHSKLRILYQYNDFFKKILFLYKGQYDYELKDAFLELYKKELKEKYKKHIVVIAPSSFKDNEKRGFTPNKEIVKIFSNNIYEGLYKTMEYKQTSQKDRTKVKDAITIKNDNILNNKRVLLFDDVMTSGSTIKTCIDLINSKNPKSIEILILSTNRLESIKHN